MSRYWPRALLRILAMAKAASKSAPLPYVAMVLAWVIPGVGHYYLGRRRRAIIIFLTVGVLFWSGVAVGGVMTVDFRNERWWFVADMCSGVHGFIGWYCQKQLYHDLDAKPGVGMDQKMQDRGVALVPPAETVARAYAGVAGLLNLLCIFDALMLAVMGVRGETAAEEEAREPRKKT